MPNNLSFFAINADDVPRARTFYEAVFGWGFEPWGPPDFYLIETGKGGGRPRRAAGAPRARARAEDGRFRVHDRGRRTSTRPFARSRRTAAASPHQSSTSRRWAPSRISSTPKATWRRSFSQNSARDRRGGPGQRLAGRHSQARHPVGRADRDRDRRRRWRYPFHGGRRTGDSADHIEGIDELDRAGLSVVPRRAGRESDDPRPPPPRTASRPAALGSATPRSS